MRGLSAPLPVPSDAWSRPMAESASGVVDRRPRTAISGSCYFLMAKLYTTLFRSRLQALKVKYFQDTDTLYIEFRVDHVEQTRDLDENTLLDLDDQGRVCALTMEHASQRTDIPGSSYEQIAA